MYGSTMAKLYTAAKIVVLLNIIYLVSLVVISHISYFWCKCSHAVPYSKMEAGLQIASANSNPVVCSHHI